MTSVTGHVAPCGEAFLPPPCPVSRRYEAAVGDDVALLPLSHHGVVHLHTSSSACHSSSSCCSVDKDLMVNTQNRLGRCDVHMSHISQEGHFAAADKEQMDLHVQAQLQVKVLWSPFWVTVNCSMKSKIAVNATSIACKASTVDSLAGKGQCCQLQRGQTVADKDKKERRQLPPEQHPDHQTCSMQRQVPCMWLLLAPKPLLAFGHTSALHFTLTHTAGKALQTCCGALNCLSALVYMDQECMVPIRLHVVCFWMPAGSPSKKFGG